MTLSSLPAAHAVFRERLLARTALTGTFLKAPTGIVTEWLGAIGYDFVVIDQEHSAFGAESTDGILLAARAANLAALVRVPSDASHTILSALDGGAAGIVVPHVQSAQQAREIVAATRYRAYGAARGFALATRAAGYSQIDALTHIESSNGQIAVIAQIEDEAGLAHADAIAQVDGIDALFIGRGDLSVALGLFDANHPDVLDASRRIAAAARQQGKAVSAFVSGTDEATALAQAGVTAFMLASDQVLLQRGARDAAAGLRDALARVSA